MINFTIREIEKSDYNKNYLEILKQLSNYDSKKSYDDFVDDLERLKNICKIFVIENLDDNLIIGAGTVYIIKKLHTNPICQIEDVVIDEKYRGNGLGKLLIQQLIKHSKMTNCYKIVLNAIEKNIYFYESLNFTKVAYQFKFIG